MSPDSAALAARLITLYLGLGVAFAIPFVWRWAGRLDPVAREGTPGFRLLLLPGAMLLWPWLAVKLVRTSRRPAS